MFGASRFMGRGAAGIWPAIAVACALLGAMPRAGTAQAPPPADRYELDATLAPERNELDGRAHIRWTNRSRVAIDALFFHLYPNAFRSSRTLFMREHGHSLRGTRLSRSGGIDVLELRRADGADLLARARTDLVPDDMTQMRVDLPAPLPPGARIELNVRFRVRLPSIVARMGGDGQFFMLAQWFPKLAVLEQDGRWASFPYHGLGEFYADFADYTLTVHVPSAYGVAAPGEREAGGEQNGMRSERYVLRSAVDVAWSAYPRFRKTSIVRDGLAVDVFAPPGHGAFATQQAQLVHDTIAELGHRLGAYPYRRIVLVLPPPSAIGAAGMEYPGLVVGWPLTWDTELNPAAQVMQDVVTAHELAHQWFALLVASHETETPVLDEGLAEWTGLDVLREKYGHAFFRRWLGLPIDLFELHRAAYARAARARSSLEPAYAYGPEELSTAVYVRPALALESVARTWGRARLHAALGAYARGMRFRHPKLADLWAALDGGYWRGFAQQVVEPMLVGTTFDTRLERGAQAGTLRAARDGEGTLPGTIAWLDARGESRAAWPPGPSLEVRAGAPPLLGASIDPDRHNLLDRARRDDQLRTDGSAPASPLLARLLLWAQALLAGLGP